eukprot:SAG31_NODE_9215_length_1315_cov_1.165296_1_plen_307_part_01
MNPQDSQPRPGQSGAGAPKSWLDGTAFRKAEKRYKHYKHTDRNRRCSRQQPRGERQMAGTCTSETDFSDVFDLRDLANNLPENARRIRRVDPGGSEVLEGALTPVYQIEGVVPGLYIMPAAISIDLQSELAVAACSEYHCRPHSTNLTNLAADVPKTQQLQGAQDDQGLKSEPDAEPEPELAPQNCGTCCLEASLDAVSKLNGPGGGGLRWATLGYQFQCKVCSTLCLWPGCEIKCRTVGGTRSYDSAKRTPVPTRLSSIGKDLVRSLAVAVGTSPATMHRSCSASQVQGGLIDSAYDYEPHAAIVN